MEHEESKGEVTANRFVAFLDILGFKDMVMKYDHDHVLQKIMTVKDIKKTVIDGTNQDMPMDTNLQSVLFSDTILIFSIGETAKDLIHLLHQLRVLLGVYYKEQIPIKGAISYGKITADFSQSVFVGQPIIDAYLLQEELHMFGVILDHKTENKMNELAKQEPSISQYLDFDTVRYKVPTKNGKINHYCLNWPFVVIPPNGEQKHALLINHDREGIEKFYTTVSGKPRIYIDNTLDFIDCMFEAAKIKYPNFKIFQPPKRNS